MIVVYDIETLKSCFTYTAVDINTNEVFKFVIHKDLFQIDELYNHLTDCQAQIGFNNINFDYPVSIGDGNKLEAGKYRLSMTVYGQKNNDGKFTYVDSKGKEQKFDYQWKFTKDFTILGKTASKLNAKDVTVKKTPWYENWLIWLGLLLIILAISFLLFILWKRRKKEEEEEQDLEKEKLKAQLEEMREQISKEDNSDETDV